MGKNRYSAVALSSHQSGRESGDECVGREGGGGGGGGGGVSLFCSSIDGGHSRCDCARVRCTFESSLEVHTAVQQVRQNEYIHVEFKCSEQAVLRADSRVHASTENRDLTAPSQSV